MVQIYVFSNEFLFGNVFSVITANVRLWKYYPQFKCPKGVCCNV